MEWTVKNFEKNRRKTDAVWIVPLSELDCQELKEEERGQGDKTEQGQNKELKKSRRNKEWRTSEQGGEEAEAEEVFKDQEQEDGQ